IATQVPNVAVAPTASSMSTAIVGNKNWPTSVLGVTETYFAVRDWEVGEGRAFEESELNGARPVCIIGTTTKSELFGEGDVLGQKMRLGKLTCEVVGVMAEKATSMGSDANDIVLVPLKTF